MAWLNNFKIGARLGAGFAIVLLLLCAVGGIGLRQAASIFSGTEEIGSNWLPSVEILGKIEALSADARRSSLRSIISVDAADQQAQRAEREQTVTKLNATLDEYSKLVSSPEEQKLYDGIKGSWAQYVAVDNKVGDLVAAGDASAADARALAAGDASTKFATVQELINEDIKLNHDGSVHEVESAASAYHSIMITTSVLILIAVSLGVTIAVLITRSITVPVRRSVVIAETVAQGDLTTVIEVHGRDETSQLLNALRNMNEKLVDVVGRVRSSSESIATGSAEIAAGNTDLSQRTEEQAASLEETASSMEELTATVKQNAENARQGNSLAGKASETAARGGDVVGRVVQTMNEISGSSAQVAQIISVIEGIAFQTNILALNAAVEAARAGEQGRGFAVVAGEVRTLAQRSASAAKEIKDLIGASVDRVNSGSALVNDAGRTMVEIVQAVKQVADLMGEISAASGEQHTGIEQVNQAVMQMDQVTQQNAALVEEASAAAQSMAAQSGTLRELVSVFRLNAAYAGVTSGTEPALKKKPVASGARKAAPKLVATPAQAAAKSLVVAKTADWQSF